MTNFKPMLAKDAAFDTEGKSKFGFPQIVQPKLDGIRASVVDGKLLTRTLKEVPNREIFNALSKPEFEGLDGELIVGSPTAADCYRATASFVMARDKTGEPWTYHVFDQWNLSNESFTVRLDILRSRQSAIDEFPRLARLVASQTAFDSEQLEDIESRWVSEGFEGVILRDPSAPYKFGRSGKTGPLLKLKRFIDFEAKIVGAYEEQHNANEAKTNALGRTERSSAKAGKEGKGTLGGFYLQALNGPAEGVEFKCGTGFDAEQRRVYWNEIDPVGMIAKVKSFPIGVKDRPRHPVWLGMRDTLDL